MSRPKSKVTSVVVAGPLRPFTGDYAGRLVALGYTPLSIVNDNAKLLISAAGWRSGA